MSLWLTEIIFLVICFLLGAIMGSFACCQAWRLKFKWSNKKFVKDKKIGNRSMCLSCGHRLSVVENIPIFSWLILRGKCKKCGKKIGAAEIISEISLGVVFALIGMLIWPEISYITKNSWAEFCYFGLILLLLAALTIMWILMICDAKWGKMPTKILLLLNVIGALFFGLKLLYVVLSGNFAVDFLPLLLQALGSVTILAGTYFVLYIVSKERLVGGGDWLLALPIAIILGNWWLALVTLFLSNLFASVFGIIKKIKTKDSKIYFGPFLVFAFVTVFILQQWVLSLIIW